MRFKKIWAAVAAMAMLSAAAATDSLPINTVFADVEEYPGEGVFDPSGAVCGGPLVSTVKVNNYNSTDPFISEFGEIEAEAFEGIITITFKDKTKEEIKAIRKEGDDILLDSNGNQRLLYVDVSCLVKAGCNNDLNYNSSFEFVSGYQWDDESNKEKNVKDNHIMLWLTPYADNDYFECSVKSDSIIPDEGETSPIGIFYRYKDDLNPAETTTETDKPTETTTETDKPDETVTDTTTRPDETATDTTTKPDETVANTTTSDSVSDPFDGDDLVPAIRPVAPATQAPNVTSAPAEEVTGAYSESVEAPADVVPSGAVLEVKEETKEDAVKAVEAVKVTDANKEVVETVKKAVEADMAVVVEIDLVKDGVKVQPNGTIKVTVNVPIALKDAAKLFVYRVEADGTFTDVKAVISGGKIVFSTTHFSTYIITSEALSGDAVVTEAPEAASTTTAAPAPSQNNNKNQQTGAVLAIVPAIIAAAGVVISKKRK